MSRDFPGATKNKFSKNTGTCVLKIDQSVMK